MEGKVRMVRVIAMLLGLLGVASIVYGITVMRLNSGTWFFAVWYVIGACFIAAAVATYAQWWVLLPVALRAVGVAALAVLLVTLGITQALILGEAGSQGEDDLDYIIVLGAQVRPDYAPSGVLQFRLEAALEYLEANPRTRCIVSGGQGSVEPCTEADCMADYLEKRGIAAARIEREDRSENTLQNIEYSMAFFNPETDRVGIVTNDFHLYRATRIAQKAGIRHVCGIGAYSVPWYQPNNMLREGMGIVKDFLAGNL